MINGKYTEKETGKKIKYAIHSNLTQTPRIHPAKEVKDLCSKNYI